jgi:hypothetical protein
VWGDAAATAANILGAETLFRLGLAGEMLTCVCDVALSVILYVLLKPAGRVLALLAAAFRLTFVAIYGVSKLFEVGLVALVVVTFSALEPEELHAWPISRWVLLRLASACSSVLRPVRVLDPPLGARSRIIVSCVVGGAGCHLQPDADPVAIFCRQGAFPDHPPGLRRRVGALWLLVK